jgi:hypothetical protein
MSNYIKLLIFKDNNGNDNVALQIEKNIYHINEDYCVKILNSQGYHYYDSICIPYLNKDYIETKDFILFTMQLINNRRVTYNELFSGKNKSQLFLKQNNFYFGLDRHKLITNDSYELLTPNIKFIKNILCPNSLQKEMNIQQLITLLKLKVKFEFGYDCHWLTKWKDLKCDCSIKFI